MEVPCVRLKHYLAIAIEHFNFLRRYFSKPLVKHKNPFSMITSVTTGCSSINTQSFTITARSKSQAAEGFFKPLQELVRKEIHKQEDCLQTLEGSLARLHQMLCKRIEDRSPPGTSKEEVLRLAKEYLEKPQNDARKKNVTNADLCIIL